MTTDAITLGLVAECCRLAPDFKLERVVAPAFDVEPGPPVWAWSATCTLHGAPHDFSCLEEGLPAPPERYVADRALTKLHDEVVRAYVWTLAGGQGVVVVRAGSPPYEVSCGPLRQPTSAADAAQRLRAWADAIERAALGHMLPLDASEPLAVYRYR